MSPVNTSVLDVGIAKRGIPRLRSEQAPQSRGAAGRQRLPRGVYPELDKILRGVYAEERIPQNNNTPCHHEQSEGPRRDSPLLSQ